MRMPVMNGYEAIKRIKATDKGQTTSIIALTASSLIEERTMVLATGCDGYLRKPFRETELFELMREHLGLEYIYTEDDTAEPAIDAEAREAMIPAALGALSAELLDDLKQAALTADVMLVAEQIERIRSENSTLADALGHLAKEFNYPKITFYIQQVEGKNHV